LGSAEITHPFHPLRGQRFPILKRRRVRGVDTLLLQGTTLGSFAVSREWTDQANPPLVSSNKAAPILEPACLIALADLAKESRLHLQKGIDP
jgi:Family of unknown function (DUF5372)